MRWLIAAGHHPRASATTLRIAEDLADRMDYSTGHVRYCLDEMVARLGISRASIARHVSYLRELGALAWVQHGTRANVRRFLGLGGYAATATVYGAVIPAVYDHAMGHRIVGSGYEARIIVDQRNQAAPVDNPPVDNSTPESLETPSLTMVKEESQVQMVGGSNYTSQARQAKTSIPHQSSSKTGQRRTATDVRKAAQAVRLVRALVNWTQKLPLRRLEYVLRPWTDRGWDAFRIADELNGMCAGVRWKPSRPDAFIRARITNDLQREQQQTAELQAQEQAVAWEDSTAARDLASLAALFGPAAPAPQQERTDEDRAHAQLHGWNQWEEVAAHLAEDQDDAIDLYGIRICQFAISQQARLERQGAYA
ncbi:hypothetical protein ACFV0T_26575 [Streptomyces sp. NPDC059582]|uniref:hypothetical protein n=1 Tax=Streptomyces sp. NPDC059582 TaxID=3346875 RepID=UPI0036B21FB1